MAHHLHDTDGIINALKGVAATITFFEELAEAGNSLCVAAVVRGEVYAGLRPQDEAAAERFLATLEYLPTSAAAARQAGRWRYRYERQGQRLSLTDCLIAATAREHRAVLVTANAKDFPMPEVTVLPIPRPSGG